MATRGAKTKKPVEKKPMGRPTDYSDEVALIICERVAISTDSLKTICDNDPNLPDQATVNKWRWIHDDFRNAYHAAKLHQAELMAEEIRELAKDKLYYRDSEGNSRVDAGYTQSMKLEVDTTKWLAARLLPKIYGDKSGDDETKQKADSLIERLLDKISK